LGRPRGATAAQNVPTQIGGSIPRVPRYITARAVVGRLRFARPQTYSRARGGSRTMQPMQSSIDTRDDIAPQWICNLGP
jgi:hypothetical protein